jgi:uncharacterized protein
MLVRSSHEARIAGLLDRFPVVGLVGARQVGKTTLARSLRARSGDTLTGAFFDLEDPRDVARLDPAMFALEPLRGLVVLDEIQHRPDLFGSLRVLADRPGSPARFLVLGSASDDLLRQGSETLAGRIAWYELGGLALDEVGSESSNRLWLRGGFPRSFTAESDAISAEWRREFVRTYLERDLGTFGVRVPATTMRRFWSMLAHYHGQVWNAAALARAFGVTEKTVRRYLEILGATFMVRRLEPWFENMQKRQVRSPKVYLNDSGLLHTLLGVETRDELLSHPKVGASFEGFAIQEIVRAVGARTEECFFWGVHTGAELDLLVVRGTRRLGFEVKLTDAPRTTRSMHSALQQLKLDRIDVVHAGDRTFELAPRIRAVSVARLGVDLADSWS